MSAGYGDIPSRRNLEGLPTKGDFRLRGLEMTRVETFTDAAFAFAVTLLVISIDEVPRSYPELVDALKGLPAFGFSFALVMLFWYAHWSWSQRFGLDDGPTILISGTLVFTVLGYVYPLKYLSELFVEFLSGGLFSTNARLDSVEELYAIFAIYGVGFVAMSLMIVALHGHAYRKREELELNELELHETRAQIQAWLLAAGVGALSFVFAVATPPSRLVLPGWVYWLLPVSQPILSWRFAIRRRRILDES